jgi:hypothetical protein
MVRKHGLITLWLVVLATPPICAEPAAATRPANAQQAIIELGDPRFAVREQASGYLLEYGPSAEPLLARAAISPDPEVSDRARRILQDFSLGVLLDTPPAVRALLGRYSGSDVTQKEITLNQLSRQGGFGVVIILRLSQEEIDPAVRAKAADLAHECLPEIQRTAEELVAESHPESARQLLECAAAAGDDNSVRPLAVLLLDADRAEVMAAIGWWRRVFGGWGK